MSGTFAPAPGSAPTLRKVTAQGSMELRLILRNGEQLLLALVIPILVLIGGVQAAGHLGLLSSDAGQSRYGISAHRRPSQRERTGSAG